MTSPSAAVDDPRAALLALYDSALPLVYGYLLPRCGGVALAEDLTAETFLAAVDAARRDDPPAMTVPWIVGVARHKLIDHWRRAYREERCLRAVADDGPVEPSDDPWDMHLDVVRARETLRQLAPHHRAALTLRYLDDLPVKRVATMLDRSVHATEALLVRARAAFRRAYRPDESPEEEPMADPARDPLEGLHSPIVPTAPDPAFAADLRARIDGAARAAGSRRVVDLPEGVTVSDPAGPRHGDVGYVSLWVPDVERAANFFAAVLGWQYAPGSSAQGRQIEGIEPAHGLFGDQDRGTLFLCFVVDDVDETLERVRDAGGIAGEPQDAPYGRVADCVDDQGVPFALVSGAGTGRARASANGTRAGDLAYITMEVVDSVKARAFYGSVLGWRFGPGSVVDGWGVDDVVPMVGMAGGQPQATVVPMYRVDEIDAAVERVRAAGGTASDPEHQPYGITSSCTDDQGTRFSLGRL